MDAGYELFDHTADIGIRAWAPTMPGLLRPAAEGLYAVIGELVATAASPPTARELELTGDVPAVLLRDYLAELLMFLERDHLLATEHAVQAFDRDRLVVRARMQPVDAGRSNYQREVKAVTYHALDIVEIPGGFEATIIVDI
jgi:SHS2 domain-containing protein